MVNNKTNSKQESVARSLYDVARLAHWKRANSKESLNDADLSKVGCDFDQLWPAPKSHYLAMAEWVLNNFIENTNKL